MKILALEKEVPGVSEDQFTDDILKAEARKAWKLQQTSEFGISGQVSGCPRRANARLRARFHTALG